ncbi:MAG: hypothetical protein QF566_01000 [Candidatus Thalassarchaeaceae archaeon]|nr:hypothetical protein [Candidatus Thalassarchaeaceae archaeon]
MARGRGVLFTLLIVVSMMLPGCLYPDIQEWGSDGIEVSMDNNAKTATMSTHTGDLVLEDDVANLLGCDSNGNFSAAANQTSIDKKVRVEGWLHLSQHFPDGAISSGSGEMMSASAVIIELGEYDEASGPTEGKVDGVKWNTPSVGVQARPPGFDSSNKFPHLGWAVVGLIPANEEILEGFAALDWHQPIALEGWLLDGSYMGYSEIHMTEDGKCRIYAGPNQEGFSGTLLVTSMTLGEHGLIDEDNSYNAYSVPIIGKWIFSVLVLLSFGVAFLLFLAIMGLIRRGAAISARELLTEAQMIAARGVKSDFKKAIQDIEEETGRKVDTAPAKARAPKVEKTQKTESVDLGDFDIDSAIHGAHRPSARSVSTASSGGVVETEESVEMQDQMDEMDATRELEEVAKERGGGVFIPEGSIIVPDSESTKQRPVKEETASPARKVRKTKPAKKEPEPEPKPAPPTKSGPDITDDEDFSDFSFD